MAYPVAAARGRMPAASAGYAPPAAFGWNPPLTVLKSPAGIFTYVFDPTAYAPAGTAYYVDVATGNDSNAGTLAAPLKTISAAIAKADAVVVYIKPGTYAYPTGYFNGDLPARSMAFRRWPGESGSVVWGWVDTGLTWAQDETYTHCYKTTRSMVSLVVDRLTTDAAGDLVVLTNVADVATCESTAGSWVAVGSTLYVHRADEAAVTGDNTWVCMWTPQVKGTGGYTWYFEHIDFVGVGLKLSTGVAGDHPLMVVNDCSIKYGAENGIYVTAGTLYLVDSVIAKMSPDGVNYNASGAYLPYGLELGCAMRACGVWAKAATAQASSAHYGRIVRINGEYSGSYQENIWDVDGYSWNLGMNLHDPVGASGGERASNWRASSYSGVAGGTASGATYDLDEGGSGTIYYRDCTMGGTNYAGGSYAAY